MLKKDYVLRQFEEFGKMLALILGYRHEKDWEKFEKEIADAAQKFTALEISTVEAMTAQDFENKILSQNELDQQQKTILAKLLFEKMNFYIVMDDHASYLDLKSKCIGLYQHLRENFTENEFNLDVHYKIEYLTKLED